MCVLMRDWAGCVEQVLLGDWAAARSAVMCGSSAVGSDMAVFLLPATVRDR